MRKDRYDALLKINKCDAYKYMFVCKIAIIFRLLSFIPLLFIGIIIYGISVFKEIDRDFFNQMLDKYGSDRGYYFGLGGWYFKKYLLPKYFYEVYPRRWGIKKEYQHLFP